MSDLLGDTVYTGQERARAVREGRLEFPWLRGLGPCWPDRSQLQWLPAIWEARILKFPLTGVLSELVGCSTRNSVLLPTDA